MKATLVKPGIHKPRVFPCLGTCDGKEVVLFSSMTVGVVITGERIGYYSGQLFPDWVEFTGVIQLEND